MRSWATASKIRRQKAESRSGLCRFLLSAFCFLISTCSPAPQPAVAPTTVESAQPEISTIVIPIRTTLAPLLPAIDAQVPKTVASKGYENLPNQPYSIRYRIARDPIALNMAGGGLHVTTTVRYAIEGCRITTKPFSKETTLFPCLSCGFNEPMREAWISLDTHFDWDEQWRLRTKTTARPIEFSNRCTVTFANIDISDWKIAPQVNAQLQQVAKTIDANTPKLTGIRPNAQQIWSALQTPSEIAPRMWLVIEPVDVGLTPITGSGLNVTSALSLRARTRIVVGERPQLAAKPLPPLHVARDASAGVRVPFDVELTWDEASRLLTESFGGKSYDNVHIDSLRLAPGADGKVRVEAQIDYRGGGLKKYHGLVLLDGTPRFDVATNALALDAVDYALDPHRHNPFLRIGDRVAHDALRQRLAQTARWSLAAQIADVRRAIETATTRPLAPGITMHGRVASIEPESIRLRPEGLVIRIVTTGEAAVDASSW